MTWSRADRRPAPFPALAPALLLAAGLLLSAGAGWWQARDNERRAAAALQAEGEQLFERVAERLALYQYGLRGARGAVLTAGIDTVERSQFAAYSSSRDIDSEFPGARGFGFIRRVGRARQQAFEAEAARDGWPGFAVHQLAPNDGERYVIQYIEPVERNREAVGLDVASEAARREVADKAARSGQAAISRPITLVQALGKPRHGFVIMLAVYRPGLPLGSEAERQAACVGWTFATLLVDEVLHGIGPAPDRLVLTLEDVGAEPARFYAQAGATPATLTLLHSVLGRPWRLGLRAQPAFVAALRLPSPDGLTAGGALVSLLAAALLAAFQQGWRSRRQVLCEQQRLAALVEQSSDAIVTESPEGRIVGWNAAAERLLGYSAAEALGRDAAALLLPPEGHAQALAVRERLGRGEAVEAHDEVLLHKAGQRLEMSIAVSPIVGPGSQLVGIGRTLRDISARSAAERERLAFTAALERQVAERTAELSAARRDLQAVLDAVPSMIGYWDLGLCNRFANHAYQAWFGAAPGTLTGRHMGELLGQTLFEENRPYIEAVLHGEPQTFERALPQPGGKGLRHALVHYLPDVVDGRVQGFYVLVHDVSALKEGERRLADALRENEALLATLKAHALYSVADPQGTVIDVNEGFCRISGYTREELVGQNHRLVNSGRHHRGFWVEMWRTVAAGQPWRGEICNRAKDGTLYWVDSVIAPFLGSDGKPQRYVSIRHDITASKQAEAAMLQAIETAEAANAAKSAFLANMSHEIRTPLNAMIGLTYLLDLGRLDAEQRGFVGKIQLASRSLLGVVNDVLDLAKIEAGEMHVESAPFDLRELLDGLAAMYGEQAQARGLAFRLSQPEGLPRRVIGDAGRLRQVLSNLLANAVKFTERGSVALVLRVLAQDAAGLTLGFEVHDMGIGIAPELQETVFQPFAQADASTTRRYGGSGLGLSIVRDLSALLGGEVRLESTPGKGSIFRVTLQLATAEDGGTADGASRTALDVLVVGDDLAQVAALLGQSRALGWRADAVGSADAAVETLRRVSEGGALPDVLLVDGQLRGSSGMPALARLRAEIGAERLPPVVLVDGADAAVAHTMPGDLQAGSGLALPADAATLFNAVNRAMAQRGVDPNVLLRATRLEGAGALWLPGVHLLVVDDSEINREVAERILVRQGALVTTCESATEALGRLRQTPGAFDLVLMDVQMPGMDGNEATRRIRGELGLTGLPVVALTAGALVAERQRALDAGMNDFVSKPLDPDDLIRCARRHVERSRAQPLPARLREAPEAGTGAAPWPVIDGIDGADAAQRLGHDLALFRSLLQRLFREFDDLMAEPPRVPQKETECAALAARAHKLRGSAGMLGARTVQQEAAELEARLRRPAIPGAGAAAVLALMSALARSLRRLQQASAPTLAQPATGSAVAEVLTPQARAELVDCLRVRDLAALQRFDALTAGLRATLGETRFEAARDAVENLRFAQALALLDEEETA